MRYGHQSFYEVVGRDPLVHPMSALERALFTRILVELWNDEVETKDPIDPRPSND